MSTAAFIGPPGEVDRTAVRTWSAVALGAGAICGLLAVQSPALGLAAALLALVGLWVLRAPDLAVFVVVLLLYSNFAVVASRFHGVPMAAASAFPLLLAVPLLRDLLLRREGLALTPAFPFLLFFLAVQVLGTAFSKRPEVAKSTVVEFLLEGLLIYFLVVNAVRTPRALRLAVWALLCAGFVSSIVPCYQQLTGAFGSDFGGFGQTSEGGFRVAPGEGDHRQLRLAGPIGEQNRYAQNMLMLLPLGLFLSRGERSKPMRLLAWLLTGVSGMGFLLAFSRGGAVALGLVLATMVAMRLLKGRHLALILLGGALCLAALPQYWTRMKTIADLPALLDEGESATVDSSFKGRTTEMIAAAMVFADHPLIGVGPGTFKHYSQQYGNPLGIRQLTEARRAHSLFLEVAAEEGALGLFSFLGAALVTLHGLIVARRRLLGGIPGQTPAQEEERRQTACWVTGIFLALIAYFASALFLHLAYIRFFYLVLALGGAATMVALRRSGPSPDGPWPDASVEHAPAPQG